MLTAIHETSMQLPSSTVQAMRDQGVVPEDHEVLRAVMAFLDDDSANDVIDFPSPSLSDAGSSSQSDAESTTSSAGKTPKRKSRRDTFPRVINRSRMRRRHEVLSLREQVIALEERLAALQSGESDGADPTASEKDVKQVRVTAWQSVAECQREQLTAAEKERERLRGLIKEYKLSVKRVERFVKKLPMPQGLLPPDLSIPDINSQATDGLEGFEEISRNLPAMYLQINGVFSDSRYDVPGGEVRDIRIQNETTNNMSVELLESRLLPFNVETTANAVWHFHKIKATKVTAGVEEEYEEKENVLRRNFVAMIEVPNHKGKARGRMETRRFIEHDRVVILQCSVFDRMDRIYGSLPEWFGMRQFQWTVIGPPRSERLRKSGRPLSQIETFEVTIPFLESPDRSQDLLKELAGLKQFCIEASHFMLELERQTVENILVNISANQA